jgi:hypothetical protein
LCEKTSQPEQRPSSSCFRTSGAQRTRTQALTQQGAQPDTHLVVQEPHAVHHPDAVMVHPEDATTADGAVVGALRLPRLAALAEARPPWVSPVCMSTARGVKGQCTYRIAGTAEVGCIAAEQAKDVCQPFKGKETHQSSMCYTPAVPTPLALAGVAGKAGGSQPGSTHAHACGGNEVCTWSSGKGCQPAGTLPGSLETVAK